MKKTLADALEAQGYSTLTDVQTAVTAPDALGRDLLVSAQTGSGKTLGFGLAIAPALLGKADHFAAAAAPLALVIAPTRELALQVKRELGWLFAKAGGVLASTVGGMDMRDERRALARGAHIVVSTPGRLRDHIMRGSIDLTALEAVVLDEADEMLDLGFREDLEFILEATPEERQTLLFSATVPAPITKLAQNYQNDALRISTKGEKTQHADIEYRALRVSARDGENAIINVLRYHEAPNAIVFCNTRAMVNRLTTRLSNRGFSVVALSGELSQSERTHALQSMRDGRARVCVATDVAARGIDLPNLDLVVHAELPTNKETLLHRSGRTGRAGRSGVSALIVVPSNRKKAERLLGWAKVQATWADAPGAEDVLAQDEARLLSSPDFKTLPEEADRDTLAKLVEQFTPEEIAGAYLRLFRARHSAPEELSAADAPAKPSEPFGPSVWFSLEGGRAAGAEPRRLLPMLCKLGQISREDVGAIRIRDEASFIELRESAVAGFLKAVGSDRTLEGGAALTQLSSPPAFAKKGQGGKPPSNPAVQGKPRKPAGPQGTTEPVDWNDAPVPRKKKPKGAPGAKPRHKSEAKAPDTEAVTPRKPRGPKPPQGKPSSKKNRARKAAAGASKKQGERKPRRGK